MIYAKLHGRWKRDRYIKSISDYIRGGGGARAARPRRLRVAGPAMLIGCLAAFWTMRLLICIALLGSCTVSPNTQVPAWLCGLACCRRVCRLPKAVWPAVAALALLFAASPLWLLARINSTSNRFTLSLFYSL